MNWITKALSFGEKIKKALKKRPKVCLSPIDIKIIVQADNKTIKANLFGINLVILYV